MGLDQPRRILCQNTKTSTIHFGNYQKLAGRCKLSPDDGVAFRGGLSGCRAGSQHLENTRIKNLYKTCTWLLAKLTTNMENIGNRGDSLHMEIPMHRCKTPKSWSGVIERKNDPGWLGWMKYLRGNIPFTITIPQVTEATRFSLTSRLSLSTISSGKTRVTNCAPGTALPVLPLPAGYSAYTIKTRISGASYPTARTTCTWLPREAFDTRVPIETTSSRRSFRSPGTWIPGDSYK